MNVQIKKQKTHKRKEQGLQMDKPRHAQIQEVLSEGVQQ